MHNHYAFVVLVVLDLATTVVREALQQEDLSVKGAHSKDVSCIVDCRAVHVGPVIAGKYQLAVARPPQTQCLVVATYYSISILRYGELHCRVGHSYQLTYVAPSLRANQPQRIFSEVCQYHFSTGA